MSVKKERKNKDESAKINYTVEGMTENVNENAEILGEIDTGTVTEEEADVTIEEEIANLKKDVEDLKDKLLRKTADFDNYRKRMQREKQEAYDYANTNLLTDLIPIMDDFDRALVAGEDKNDEEVGGLKPVVDGIKIINKQLKTTLSNKYCLEGYGEEGDEFDHDIHEAIGKCEGAVADPICSEVYLKGYKLKDRVIRPAKVMVTMPDGSIGD
ncbi:MAG TPA: nucleotide exchange factor GrpE [Treponemataceae bacterium]|nr:nucleotide exchange factor GrpE [Treponemataceae bacterium]